MRNTGTRRSSRELQGAHRRNSKGHSEGAAQQNSMELEGATQMPPNWPPWPHAGHASAIAHTQLLSQQGCFRFDWPSWPSIFRLPFPPFLNLLLHSSRPACCDITDELMILRMIRLMHAAGNADACCSECRCMHDANADAYCCKCRCMLPISVMKGTNPLG